VWLCILADLRHNADNLVPASCRVAHTSMISIQQSGILIETLALPQHTPQRVAFCLLHTP
jgi:hypothetical protein